jgi:phosphoribosylglycinamide formyltransferase-1
MKNIAVFASGSGTNAQNLIEYFEKSNSARVTIVLVNKPDAYVLTRAHRLDVPSVVFSKKNFYNDGYILQLLQYHNIDLIVLAGFLWLIPPVLVENYKNRMLNIHPALLPNYGGKGMFGHHVHEAVVANKEKESGITIHLVNEVYDSGDILFQAKCRVLPTDTADEVAAKIHELEQAHFPKVVEDYIISNL